MEFSASGRPRVGAIKMSQEAHNQPLVTQNTNKKQVCAAGRPSSGVCHYIQLSISWLLCIVIIDIDGLID